MMIDMTGQKIGKLTVLYPIKNGEKNMHWKCRCSCGNEVIVSRVSLKRNKGNNICECSKKIIEGQRFGKLTVLSKEHAINGRSKWLCKCDCGNEKIIYGRMLLNGHTKSCGCLRTKLYNPPTRHNERLYGIWRNMRGRCYGRNRNQVQYYKARGITVCDEWNDYEVFKAWAMANGYKNELLPSGKNKWTIDRIDNNGNYEPSNCRWITQYEQASNTRKNRWITVNGQTRTHAQWSRILGVSPASLHGGLSRSGIKYIFDRMPPNQVASVWSKI